MVYERKSESDYDEDQELENKEIAHKLLIAFS